MAEKLPPRGIRNNNPGNIEWGSPWQGLRDRASATDDRFAQFIDPASGIRALAVTLITYQDKRRAADGTPIDTIYEAISRWAPSFENNVDAYAREVAKAITKSRGIETGPHDVLDFHEYDTMFGLVSGIIRHENGPGPKTTGINTWYDDVQIEEGLRRAGVVKPVKDVAGTKVPVTPETTAAGGVAAIGVVQVADVVPAMVDAMEKSHTDLTSGQWLRIGIGVVSVALAVYIAFVQAKKRKAGQI